jgi:DNA polymerase-3 subunit beta
VSSVDEKAVSPEEEEAAELAASIPSEEEAPEEQEPAEEAADQDSAEEGTTAEEQAKAEAAAKAEAERQRRIAEEEAAAAEGTHGKVSGGPLSFRIKKASFLLALEKAGNTVSSKENEPLLKTFNIEADDQVRILSTDLSLGSIAKIRVADVVKPGAICVDAKRLISIVRAAEDGDIEFMVEDKQAVIKASQATFHINVLEADEYPEVPRFDPTSAEDVNRLKFLKAIEQTRYAASQEEVRSNLMLIAFDGSNASTSDGARLQQTKFEGLEGVQIPIFAVNNLVRLLKKTEIDTIKVELKPNHLLFQIGSDTFSTQRLFESFPDVEQAILRPAEKNDRELTVDREQLMNAVDRVRLAADEERKQLDITVLQPEAGGLPDKIQLTALSSNGELAVETLHCQTSLEAGRMICVNHQFLRDALEMNPAKQVTMLLGQDLKQRRSPIYMKHEDLKSVLLQLRPE